MTVTDFIAVGENIHCTRIYKVGGKFVKPVGEGDAYVIEYKADGEIRKLPVPGHLMETADWENGKIKHCAAAIWQGCYGEGEARELGADYIRAMAVRQEAAGARYLDINVDEFSTDVDERARLITWTVETAQQAVSIPMSIDSSNIEILRAGLSACDPNRGRPMVNSVSLERPDAIELAKEFNAVVIASAAGENDLPTTVEDKLANLERLMPMLEAVGLKPADLHIDPLVLPISVDGQNGRRFLDTVSAVRKTYGPEVHIVAGLSNVSFGMPKRKIINQTYAWLAVEVGADGGIVDPLQINGDILSGLDTESEGFKMAKALLLGEDDFGMAYITAAREGKI